MVSGGVHGPETLRALGQQLANKDLCWLACGQGLCPRSGQIKLESSTLGPHLGILTTPLPALTP